MHRIYHIASYKVKGRFINPHHPCAFAVIHCGYDTRKVGILMGAQPAQIIPSGIEIMRLNATIQDLENTPADGYRYELLKGVLFRMPLAKEYHGAICMLIGTELAIYCKAHGMWGQVVDNAGHDFSSPTLGATVLGPDIAVSASPIKSYGPYRKTPPLLAVEVASPSDSHPYLADRAHLFLAAGVPLVWVMWPEAKTVDVWTPPAATVTLALQDTLDGGTVLPGLMLPVADIFP
jgi:Uma2 family endonuclease